MAWRLLKIRNKYGQEHRDVTSPQRCAIEAIKTAQIFRYERQPPRPRPSMLVELAGHTGSCLAGPQSYHVPWSTRQHSE